MHTLTQVIHFFSWIGICHYINFFFLFLLIRSGIEVLSAHPKLYWSDHCPPERPWLKLTRREMPKDRLWTSADEEESWSPWIAMPGRRNLGLGRHWHFASLIFWVLNGLTYIVLLFVLGEWRRLIPTSWSVFPDALKVAWTYMHFQLPPVGNPYNPLQQLTYAGVVFILSPLTFFTGAAMSPAINGRFPWYPRIFGGRQVARSIHFFCLVAFIVFTVIHVTLVIIENFPANMALIIHGNRETGKTASVWIGLAGLLVAFLFYFWSTLKTLRSPRRFQQVLDAITDVPRRLLLSGLISRQNYPEERITPNLRVNGYPPKTDEYLRLSQENFQNWRLEVGGLVERPLQLSLNDLKMLPSETYISLHNCIQGWSGIAKWSGPRTSELFKLCQPKRSVQYLVLWAFDLREDGRPYYEVISVHEAAQPQCILAHSINGAPLSIPHGAPCRLRFESGLGYKMVKYLRRIDFVENYQDIGDSQGGYREDVQHYSIHAEI